MNKQELEEEKILNIARIISKTIKKKALYYDENPQFQEQNFTLLIKKKYLTLAIPKSLGGLNISMPTIILAQLELAKGDASTALGIGMHTIVCGYESENFLWSKKQRESIFTSIVQNGLLINNIASEAELGSPKNGGLPTTEISIDSLNKLRLNGKKNWATLSTGLTFMVVYAINKETNRLCRVLIRTNSPGISINKNWNGLGMRSTESHEVIFKNVLIKKTDILYEHGKSKKYEKIPINAWFPLIIAATSMGIAIEARNKLIVFLQNRRPSGYEKSISEIPFIKYQLGEIESRIMIAKSFLINITQSWEDKKIPRKEIYPYIVAAKREATETAVFVTDKVMRLVGGIALEKNHEFERLFRDARSGLINPPIESRALETIADFSLINNKKDFRL
ncbi:MAG: Acyl-CoA dehydrogenase [Chloroflexi bacterium]|jgi:alkylation response protein AidB-like acyl-CoA dehydrogenase|nr:MAG: Acyl-CoA dehydrogenase [Chloroflexota bacterium]|tara:strand:+ start:648 stop:1829 length:1182 start_codon:yes stop_codon:yes gene_type:complete